MADRFDLDAIEADDALLDLLAAGGESARAAGEHDLAVQLLADLRLAVEVEDELPVETIDDPESFLARCAALNPITDPFARKMATRGLAFGVAAVAALSVSGVAAAVTGDPLSPYEKVIEKMVDAVRPQTSFPKEDLDGLPVVDRSKIVKVGKDFKDKATAEHAQNGGKDSAVGDDEQAQDDTAKPMIEFPVQKPMVVLEDTDTVPVKPEPTQDPVKAIDGDKTTPEPTDTTTTKPTDTTTNEPTGTTTENPPDTPETTPTDEPTDTTTTPPPTDTTSTPTPPATVGGGTSDSGTSDNNTSTDTPTSAPSDGTGQTSDGETAAPSSDGGSGTTTPASDTGGSGGTDTSGTGTSGTDTSGTGSTETSGDDQKPVSQVTAAPEEVKEVVNLALDAIVPPVLPTPTGQPVTIESAEQFFGEPQAVKKAAKAKGQTAAKHSSGQVTTGSVRKAYPTGKHSSGQYPEGKHAAIARTHGSTADATLLTILDVVNKPIQ